jgi:hypothetical protein
MTAPKRWIDDPDADVELRDTLRGASAARGLDDATRRRLSAKVARASAIPVVAAGWLFVKSAAAALGVVVGTASIVTYTGIVKWPTRSVASAPAVKPRVHAPAAAKPVAPPPVATIEPEPEPVVEPEPEPKLNPLPSLPSAPASVPSGSSLAAESLLLEQARGEMRSAPATALRLATEHGQRFPRGQLGSERTLIQIEALHRLGRDGEARSLARGMLAGGSTGLYAERIRQLLGEDALR